MLYKKINKIKFKRKFSILTFDSLTMMHVYCGSPWVYPTFSLSNFVFPIRNAFFYYFFKYSFCTLLSPLESLIHMLLCLTLFHKSLRLFLVFFILFSFCSSDCIILVDLYSNFLFFSCQLKSALKNLFWFLKKFHSLYFFNSRIFIWF